MSFNDWTLRAWIEWFKGEGSSYSTEKLPEKSESQLVSESLLHELETSIKETEARNRARDLEERKRNLKELDHAIPPELLKQVDYSWLIDPVRLHKRPYEIMPGERMEIESLCWQILPSECNKVIMQFREYLAREPAIYELPGLFRGCLQQTLQSRPLQEADLPQQGLLKAKRSNKIIPFSQSMMDLKSRRNSQEMQIRMPIKFSTLDVRTLPV